MPIETLFSLTLFQLLSLYSSALYCTGTHATHMHAHSINKRADRMFSLENEERSFRLCLSLPFHSFSLLHERHPHIFSPTFCPFSLSLLLPFPSFMAAAAAAEATSSPFHRLSPAAVRCLQWPFAHPRSHPESPRHCNVHSRGTREARVLSNGSSSCSFARSSPFISLSAIHERM